MSNVKAIVHKISKQRFEGSADTATTMALTPAVIEYATINPENFEFIYAGGNEVADAPAAPEQKVFTAAQLRRMTDGAVMDLAMSLGIEVTDSTEKKDLILAIVAKQEEAA